MSIEWLRDSVMAIAAICMIIAMVECVGDENRDDGLRLVCGAAAAATVIGMVMSCIHALL